MPTYRLHSTIVHVVSIATWISSLQHLLKQSAACLLNVQCGCAILGPFRLKEPPQAIFLNE